MNCCWGIDLLPVTPIELMVAHLNQIPDLPDSLAPELQGILSEIAPEAAAQAL